MNYISLASLLIGVTLTAINLPHLHQSSILNQPLDVLHGIAFFFVWGLGTSVFTGYLLSMVIVFFIVMLVCFIFIRIIQKLNGNK